MEVGRAAGGRTTQALSRLFWCAEQPKSSSNLRKLCVCFTSCETSEEGLTSYTLKAGVDSGEEMGDCILRQANGHASAHEQFFAALTNLALTYDSIYCLYHAAQMVGAR